MAGDRKGGLPGKLRDSALDPRGYNRGTIRGNNPGKTRVQPGYDPGTTGLEPGVRPGYNRGKTRVRSTSCSGTCTTSGGNNSAQLV